MTIQTIPRRLPEVGRLRLGQKLPAGNGTRPAALAAWRLTSKSRFRLEAAAKVYGGTVQEWADAPGEDPQWELFTESKALKVVVVASYDSEGRAIAPVSQFYESWSAGGCQRRCDGRTELISGEGCLCAMESEIPSEYQCDPVTRFSVLLPDLPGLGAWRCETKGYYGATELPGSIDLLLSLGRPMPVALVIDQRSEKRPGQPRRDFVVPMLDSRQSFMDLQALAAADPVTGEIGMAERPAIEQSGSDPAPSPGAPSDPDPTSPPTPEQEASPTEAGRSGVEGANQHSEPGAGEGPQPPDTTKPPDGSSLPRRPSGGAKRAGRGAGPGKEPAPAGTSEADQATFEAGLAERAPEEWTR